jgi:hypothetical protein
MGMATGSSPLRRNNFLWIPGEALTDAFQARETRWALVRMYLAGMKEITISKSSGTSKTFVEAVVGKVEPMLQVDTENLCERSARIVRPRSVAWQCCQ